MDTIKDFLTEHRGNLDKKYFDKYPIGRLRVVWLKHPDMRDKCSLYAERDIIRPTSHRRSVRQVPHTGQINKSWHWFAGFNIKSSKVFSDLGKFIKYATELGFSLESLNYLLDRKE